MTKMLGKLSIRALIGGLVGIMGLILSLLCAINLRDAWQRYGAAEGVAELSTANKALFEAMQVYRFERGDTASALNLSGEQSDALRKRVEGHRATVDTQLAIALPILDRATVSGLPSVRDKLKADYQAHKDLRTRADSALQQPNAASRDKDFVQSFMPKTGALLQDMENTATVLEIRMRLLDPAIGELALVRSAGWSARTSEGNKILALIGALSKHQGLSPADVAGIHVNDGRAAVAWEIVRDIVTREGAAPQLRAAFDKAQSNFFGTTTQQLDGIVRSLSAGEIPQLVLSDWQRDIAGQIGTVGAVAGVAADLITARAKETAATSQATVLLYSGMLAFAVMLAIGGFVLIRIRVSRPITAIADAMRRLSANDLGVDVPCTDRSDEVGQMANAVLVFKDNMIETERLRSEQAASDQHRATQRKSEMQELANQFQAAIGNIVDTVSTASRGLESAATTLSRTAETTQQLSTSVAAASQEASTNVNSVASASEELAGSVNEIARQVHESSKIAGEAVKQAEKTDARIAQLSQAAGRIGDVVKLITAIAEQTNLLALNATIEAARAGEAGKGFAVVAQEVKALAAQTAKATDEISTQIVGMQTATEESVAAIKEIGGTIGRISEIASAIAAAVEEQGAATQEISRNVQQAAHGTTQVATNITDVNRGASETGSASTQVLSSAKSLSNESNHLKAEVERFLSTIRAA
jgi:methyl-accepting chemotaxis protein